MKLVRFVISSLGALGFAVPPAGAAPIEGDRGDTRKDSSLYDAFRQLHTYTLANHGSHRSHSSHGSHRSSSGGGGYRAPAVPTPRAPSPPPPPTPSRPPASSQSTPPRSILPAEPPAPRTLPGNSAKFSEVVKKVQAALYVRGLYHGVIDGLIGPETKAAISRFQKENNLTITGTVTSETLDALGVVAQ